MCIERSGGEGDALLQPQPLRPFAVQPSALPIARLNIGAVKGSTEGNEALIQILKEGQGRISSRLPIIEGFVTRRTDVPRRFIDVSLFA